MGKLLVMWGIDEEKDTKSRRGGRVSDRRGGRRRPVHDWDSDATSSDDGGVCPHYYLPWIAPHILLLHLLISQRCSLDAHTHT